MILKLIKSFIIVYSVASFLSQVSAASTSGVTYHGRLIDPNGAAVVGDSVQFRIQIRTPGNENCLLYEESFIKNLSQTDGVFSITLNDGTGTRVDSSGYTIDKIFANKGTFSFTSAQCSFGTTYSPNIADGRKIQVLFNDGSFPSGQWEALQPMAVNFVPFTIEALQVGGYSKDQIIKVADGVPTANTELNSSDWSSLLSLIQGSSSLYPSQTSFDNLNNSFATLNSAVKSFAKNNLPTCTASQSLSSSDGVNFVCVNNSSGSVTSVTKAATSGNPISIGGTSTAPTIDLPIATSTTSGYLSASDWNLFNSKQASGNFITALTGDVTSSNYIAGSVAATIASGAINDSKISATANIADSKLATISTAGKVSGSAITSGNITTTGSFSTNNSISTSNVLNLYNSSTSTNKISLQAPASGVTDYTIRLPASIGTANQVLAISGVSAGVATMQWTNPASGAVTSVSSAATAGNPIVVGGSSASPTIDIPVATSTANGYLSNTDWSTFNNKLGTATTFSGDISGNYNTTSVDKIKGKAVSATAPTSAGQVLRYDGTATYVPAFLSLADIRSTITPANTMFPASTCTAAQTMTWSSLTDTMTCSNIAVAASAITSGVLAVANGGTGTNDGSINGTGALTFTAGGTNQNVTLAPSGTGYTLLNGKVGIGTATPSVALHVAGSIYTTQGIYTGSDGGYLSVDPGTTLDAAGGELAMQAGSPFTGSTNTDGGRVLLRAGNSTGSGQSIIEFATATPGSSGTDLRTSTTKMTILGNGNVGVGATTPVTKLDVSGSVRIGDGGETCSATYTGAIRYNGGNIQFCNGTDWTSLSTGTGSLSSVSGISNASGTISLTPGVGSSVVVAQSTASTSTSTGALVVQGGAGVAGNVYVGGTINSTGNITTAGNISSSGNITSAGNLEIASSVAATSGANQNSPAFNVKSNYWNGSATAVDTWSVTNVMGSGANPISTLTFDHPSGTTGSKQYAFNNGNVGIGTTAPAAAKLEVKGQILSTVYDAGASTTIDWNNGNMQYTSASCGSFTFSNMLEGGSYTLVVKGTTAGTCTFAQTSPDTPSAWKFLPANGNTTSGKETIYSFVRAGNTIYISWMAGF